MSCNVQFGINFYKLVAARENCAYLCYLKMVLTRYISDCS